jgi:urea ABC transporter ATP-binding protein UrtD
MSLVDELVVDDLHLTFGGLKVLDGLSLRVPKGELRCVIGPNGAGKTTFFNVVCGVLQPDRGTVSFEGRDITQLPVHRRARAGIVRKFQVPSVYGHATVHDNVQIAAAGSLNPFSLVEHRMTRDRREMVDDVLRRTGLYPLRDTPASALSHGQKQWLEIAMVVATEPKLMLLDEPTAGMTPAETHRTAELISTAAAGVTTIVIEHDIKFLKAIGEHVTVLHGGAVLTEGSFAEVQRNETVRDVYLGRAAV